MESLSKIKGVYVTSESQYCIAFGGFEIMLPTLTVFGTILMKPIISRFPSENVVHTLVKGVVQHYPNMIPGTFHRAHKLKEKKPNFSGSLFIVLVPYVG